YSISCVGTAPPRAPHLFPTRRSSDLPAGRELVAGGVALGDRGGHRQVGTVLPGHGQRQLEGAAPHHESTHTCCQTVIRHVLGHVHLAHFFTTTGMTHARRLPRRS